MDKVFEENWRALVEHLPDIVLTVDGAGRIQFINRTPNGAAAAAVVGKSLLEFVEPEYHSMMREALAHAFDKGESGYYEVKVRGANGAPTLYVVRTQPITDQGEVARVLVVARDVSAVEAAERLLRQSEERIYDIGANIPGMIFQLLRRQTEPTLQFSYVSDGVLMLCGIVPEDVLASAQAFTRLIHADDRAGFFRYMDKSAETLTTWNWEGRLLTPHSGERWINLRATPRCTHDLELMWDGIVLNITASKQQQHELERSRVILRELSAHREALRERERARIAREIHDELGQMLTAMAMQVAVLKKENADRPELVARLQSLRGNIEHALAAARSIVADLHPSVLDLGLVSALEWLAQNFQNVSGIECRFEHKGDQAMLGGDTAIALFRIAQEALTNVMRHARASNVHIILNSASSAWLHLEIRDDGIGLVPSKIENLKSFGLRGMHERVHMLGGTLGIDGQVGSGTLIRISLPKGLPPP